MEYKGELLPGSSGDEWILIENVQYKHLYTDVLQSLIDYLWERGEYEEILKFCEPACIMYLFDEWQDPYRMFHGIKPL